MPRAPNPETIERNIVEKAKEHRWPVHVPDTPYLYLKASAKKRNLSWLCRFSRPDGSGVATKSLGPYPEVTLEMAKNRAMHARKIMKVDGLNPFDTDVDVTEGRTTYEQVALEWINNQKFKSLKQRRNAEHLLCVYGERLLKKPIIKINPTVIHDALRPLWDGSPGQVIRALAMITAVFARAKTKRLFFGENPASWEGVQENLFPPLPDYDDKHYPSMPYDQVPEFFAKLRQSDDKAAPALMLLILTTTRPDETRGMKWDEVPLLWTLPPDRVWNIPAKRMKSKREHRVPLTDQAIEILKIQRQRHHNSKFVFPGSHPHLDKPINEKAMRRVMSKLGVSLDNATPHGFRSSFRAWCDMDNSFDFAAVEKCLAHTVGTKTVRAYARSDLLEKRRPIMDAWTAYVDGA
jgi:integrase